MDGRGKLVEYEHFKVSVFSEVVFRDGNIRRSIRM